MQDADIAMYQAKAQGRDLHAVFNPSTSKLWHYFTWRMSYGGQSAGISVLSTDHLSEQSADYRV